MSRSIQSASSDLDPPRQPKVQQRRRDVIDHFRVHILLSIFFLLVRFKNSKELDRIEKMGKEKRPRSKRSKKREQEPEKPSVDDRANAQSEEEDDGEEPDPLLFSIFSQTPVPTHTQASSESVTDVLKQSLKALHGDAPKNKHQRKRLARLKAQHEKVIEGAKRGGEEGEEEEATELDDEEDYDGMKKSNKRQQQKKQTPGDADEEEEAGDDVEMRTVFLGNVPNQATKRDIRKVFKPLRDESSTEQLIESIRFRSFATAMPGIHRKVAFITKAFNPHLGTMNAYVVFVTEEMAARAVELVNDGPFPVVLYEHRLRADVATPRRDPTRGSFIPIAAVTGHCLFLGNVPFEAQDEWIVKFFQKNGCQVKHVRLVRDPSTGLGKGFGYIYMEDGAGIESALRLRSTPFQLPDSKHKRLLRILPARTQASSSRTTPTLAEREIQSKSGKRTLMDAKQQKIRKLKQKKEKQRSSLVSEFRQTAEFNTTHPKKQSTFTEKLATKPSSGKFTAKSSGQREYGQRNFAQRGSSGKQNFGKPEFAKREYGQRDSGKFGGNRDSYSSGKSSTGRLTDPSSKQVSGPKQFKWQGQISSRDNIDQIQAELSRTKLRSKESANVPQKGGFSKPSSFSSSSKAPSKQPFKKRARQH